MKVLVLGGTGFIGRHAVQSLLARGVATVIGTRDPAHALAKVPELAARCELRAAHLERLLTPEDWAPLLEDVDALINSVGILRQRWAETYDRVHHLAPGALAKACAQRGVRLVHVSALGLHAQARSRFLTSKLRGESAIRASGADYSIARPSLLEGEGGYGAYWLRMVARWPVYAIPSSAQGRLAIVQVTDLGEALAQLAQLSGEQWRDADIGGGESLSLREHLARLRAMQGLPPALVVTVPRWLARLVAHICDLLHFTPFSFGHYELLSRDNLPRDNRLPALLTPELRNSATYTRSSRVAPKARIEGRA